MWLMAWNPITPSGRRDAKCSRRSATGAPRRAGSWSWWRSAHRNSGPKLSASRRSTTISRTACLVRSTPAALSLKSARSPGAGETSPMQFGTDASAFAVVDPTAPLLDGRLAGENRPRYVAGLLVMVSHGDPFGPAASLADAWSPASLMHGCSSLVVVGQSPLSNHGCQGVLGASADRSATERHRDRRFTSRSAGVTRWPHREHRERLGPHRRLAECGVGSASGACGDRGGRVGLQRVRWACRRRP